jgi:hypothetical protein
VEAPVHRLATLASMLRLPPPDLIKMDIEGAEYADRWRKVGVPRTREALALLSRHGYRIVEVAPSGLEYTLLRK